jgi:hypothetical protein
MAVRLSALRTLKTQTFRKEILKENHFLDDIILNGRTILENILKGYCVKGWNYYI